MMQMHATPLRFAIDEDLETKWTHGDISHLRFQIYAMHSLSGFGRAFEQKYYQKRSSIEDGDFEFGNSFRVS
jgi:hypothetical protein